MSLDRLKEHFAGVLEAMVGRRLLYAFRYHATVIKQASLPDNSVEVLIDDARLRGSGSGTLVLRHGVPGILARLLPGQRVVVAFDGGDPDKGYVDSYDQGSAAADVLEVNALTAVHLGDKTGGATMHPAARETDSVEAGTWSFVYTTPAAVPTLTVTYTPTAGAPTSFTIILAGAMVTLAGNPGAIGTTGAITSGSAKVDVE